MREFKKILSVFLAICMLTCSLGIDVHAVVIPGSNPVGTGGVGLVRGYAVGVKITNIPRDANLDGKFGNGTNYKSAIEYMLSNYNSSSNRKLAEISSADDGAGINLYFTSDSKNRGISGDKYLVQDGGNGFKLKPNDVIDVNNNKSGNTSFASSNYPYALIKQNLITNPKLFESGDAKAIINALGINMNQVKTSGIGAVTLANFHQANIGQFGKRWTDFLKSLNNDPTSVEAAYMAFLIGLKSLAGDSRFDQAIGSYMKNRNNNDAKNFIAVRLTSHATVPYNGVTRIYRYDVAMGEATSGTAAMFRAKNKNNGAYNPSTEDAKEKAYLEQIVKDNNKPGIKAKPGGGLIWDLQTIMQSYYIGSYGSVNKPSGGGDYDFRYTLVPIDSANANVNYDSGYTFIADTNVVKEAPKPRIKHFMKTWGEPRNAQMIREGTEGIAKLAINVKNDLSDTKAIDGIKQALDRFALAGDNRPIIATLEITRTTNPEAGSVIDVLDSNNNELKSFKYVNSGNKAIITFDLNEGVKADQNKFFSNYVNYDKSNTPRSFVFQDKGITDVGNGEIHTVWYDIKFKVNYPSRGEETLGGKKYGELKGGEYIAKVWAPSGPHQTLDSDIAKEYAKFYKAPELPMYTNSMEQPLAELKNNRPGSETFEAMAGVPTTRDLYLGTGATEFLVDYRGNIRTNPDTSRRYTFNYTVTDCIESNAKCTGTCPGHCPGHTDKDGNSYGGGTHCGPIHTSRMPCGGLVGCEHNQSVNEWHPHEHTFSTSIVIPISTFNYMDMEQVELWKVDEVGLHGNSDLLTKPEQSKKVNLGYNVFNEGDYSSDNGRILFSQNLDSSGSSWGDNTWSKSGSKGKPLVSQAEKEAIQEINSVSSGLSPVGAKVVSDYMVIRTSEGYQTIYYHDFSSDNQVPTAFTFSSNGQTHTTPKITFNAQNPDLNKLWGNKTENAAREENGWTEKSVVYSGYNGEYSKPTSKYKTSNQFVTSTSPAQEMVTKNQPRRKYKAGASYGKYDNNDAMRISSIDIIDRALNGEYDTGDSYIKYSRELMEGRSESIFGSGTVMEYDTPYSSTHDKVNDIVVHNPTSAENAVVISNPSSLDKRTDAELFQGGDPIGSKVEGCPLDATCEYAVLSCTHPLTEHTSACLTQVVVGKQHSGGLNTHIHTDACYHKHNDSCGIKDTTGWTHIHCIDGCRDFEGTCTGKGCSLCARNVPFSNNTYPNDNGTSMIWYHNDSGCSYSGEMHATTSRDKCTTCGHSCGYLYKTGPACGFEEGQQVCKNEFNTHRCTTACKDVMGEVVNCTNPHHYMAGEPADPNNSKFHYNFGDPRCWKPCGNDANHSDKTEIKLPGGGTAKVGGAFINIDREFEIYYPFTGDFAQSPTMLGIGETSSLRGKGYYDNMSTKEWNKERFVVFNVNVIEKSTGASYKAGEEIDLNAISRDAEMFTFYAVLDNNEQVSSETRFLSVANNSPEYGFYDESVGITNKDRSDDLQPNLKAAQHTAAKSHFIDVVGYIGALTINDTGDFRFANLFKVATTDNKWLIPGLVKEVDPSKPRTTVSDTINARLDKAVAGTSYHSVYGVTYAATGGKAHPFLKLPLTPDMNNIESLRNQPMRPGYNLYMDFETIGNYYGENINENYVAQDSIIDYKAQIRPMYYSLNLDTGVYTPVDVYYGVNGEYIQAYKFGYKEGDNVNEYNYFLDWMNESARRNYTGKEKQTSEAVQSKYTKEIQNYDENGNPTNISRWMLRLPPYEKDIIGSANMLFLNDLNRTFVGSDYTYGVNKNPHNKFDTRENSPGFDRQSQRWQFTVGLPSSSVFVEAGKPCTDKNIKALTDTNSVIVCSLDIKVRGEVWTLEYDGSAMNSNGLTIFGKRYDPPKDLTTGKVIEDPLVVVYDAKKTSADDLTTEGSH